MQTSAQTNNSQSHTNSSRKRKSSKKITPRQFLPSEKRQYWILIVGFLIVALIFTVPHLMNWYNQMKEVNVIGGLQKDVLSLSETEIDKLKKSAEEYNNLIYIQQQSHMFDYQGEKADKDDKRYNKELQTNKSSNVMAELEIPKIHVDLPVAHGTNASDLDHELGHMYGSSLPWGGKNTHSVITGHTGLKSADLFTNLTKLKKGDKFYIHVLDEVHEYTVDQITVVLPEDEAPYMQIEDGKDLCTLYTCTPYGVNDHRLLVRGYRSGTEKIKNDGSSRNRLKNLNWYTLLHFLLWLLPAIGVITLGTILYRRRVRQDKAYKQMLEDQKNNLPPPPMPPIYPPYQVYPQQYPPYQAGPGAALGARPW